MQLNSLTDQPIIEIAPMMDWTDRHCRYFLRLISRYVLLYTEMIHANAILYGNTDALLAFHPQEKPLAIQLGGSEPTQLAKACEIINNYGFYEINLNLGCPSPRVQSGQFGACLMKQAALVVRCLEAMASASTLPITVKTRVGVDDLDDYSSFANFIETLAKTGVCKRFIIHARKAWLKGLSPHENRNIPPLQYEKVYQLKKDFPDLNICINGGVTHLSQITAHLRAVDSVMIGRAAYHNPYLLATIDKQFFDANSPVKTREMIVQQMQAYAQETLSAAPSLKLHKITRHMLGLFYAQPGSKYWRTHLSTAALAPAAEPNLLQKAMLQAHASTTASV